MMTKIDESIFLVKQESDFRVLIVGENAHLHGALKSLKSKSLNIETVSDECKIFEKIRVCDPHIVLLDTLPRNHNIPNLIRGVKKTLPKSTLLCLVPYSDKKLMGQALQCGASFLLKKPCHPLEIVSIVLCCQEKIELEHLIKKLEKAVRSAIDIISNEIDLPGNRKGKTSRLEEQIDLLNSTANLILWNRQKRTMSFLAGLGLTKRESEVAFSLCNGDVVEAVATRMCISIYTLKTHLKFIYKKLDVHSRAGLSELLNKIP